jgi:aryl-alcohol dehydrogenase-like predicted oxidoreductase
VPGEADQLDTMKLALGTAQFGLDYGVSNIHGQSPAAEVRKILELASREGVELLDTAPNYGSAEKIVGEIMRDIPGMNAMTKVPALNRTDSCDIYATVDAALTQSCDQLNRDHVYGLLVHKYQDLTGPFGEVLMEALFDLKKQGRVERVGVSAYDYNQIAPIIAKYPIDLVQMPLNVLDQRLLHTPAMADHHAAGIELHVRSVFLQGVLLISPSELPDFLSPLAPTLRAYERKIHDRGISKLVAALAFACQQSAITRIIVGVTTARELEELLDAYDQAVSCEFDFSEFAVGDEALISPGNWPDVWPPENLARITK